MKLIYEDINDNLAALYDVIGEEKFLEVVRLYGGSNLYFPTYASVIRANRNREIIKKYNGVNVDVLAREYGISMTQVRNIVNG